jgi:predicted glutamine amidotransferase
MCRLLAYAASEPTTFPAVVGDSFSQFIELSSLHCDGWGIAGEAGQCSTEAVEARHSQTLRQKLADSPSTAALLHLRWATAGIPVDIANNHPFAFQGLSFIHNGSLTPSHGLDKALEPLYMAQIKSESDSHRYFMLLAQEIAKGGLDAGILKTIETARQLTRYASLNAMLLTDDYLVVINEHNLANKPVFLDDEYYELRYIVRDGAVIAGSSGWNQEGWTLLENHTILIIKRDDLTMRTVTIPA